MSWRDPKFKYHPADSHYDSQEFRQRLDKYEQDLLKAIGNCEQVIIKNRQVLPIKRAK